MKELTKAEEEVMQHLWEMDRAFVKDIIQKMPKPRPAYNTVSTIIRILEKKGFVDHEKFGNSYRYYPLVSWERYREFALKKVMNNYFSNSVENLLSFFARKKDLNIEELEELLSKIKKQEDE